jgi:hypothetical protein
MYSLKNIRVLSGLALLLSLTLSFNTLAGDDKKDDDKKKEEGYRGKAVLWQEPIDITTRDLYWGPGGEAMKPDLRSITFIKEEKGGYSTKYRVRDGSGRVWVAKLSKESQPETVANRLMWAVGYVTEISYLVPRVFIPGKGEFENVRFEARPDHIKRVGDWGWDDNPFIGTREFQGLKVMMILLNNWDIKDSNNTVLYLRNAETGRNELRFIVSDLGATFGKTGSFVTRSRNKPEDFVDAEFIDEIKGEMVDFHYSGKRKGVFRDITIDQARWIGDWLARLSDRQIKEAFRAANYSPDEVEMLASTLRARITELTTLPERPEVVGRQK